MAPLWPILRSRALDALPGKGGSVTAVTALLGLLPFNAMIGWVGARVGLTTTLLVVAVAGFGAVASIVRRMP
jgi:hypothetical protein